MSGTATDHLTPAAATPAIAAGSVRAGVRPVVPRWERVLLVGALLASALALWATLRAGFLAYPGWLAVQKADFIIGPIGVGLYWHYRRPGNRLGLLLILLGLLGTLYIASSFNNPWSFGIGVYVEVPLVFLTEAAILAFPSGRLDGRVERGILIFMALTFVVGRTAIWLTSPNSAPWFSISQCRDDCPANSWAIGSPLGWTPDLISGIRVSVIIAAASTVALLVWKFVAGTPPRRRALIIGAPIAVLYLLLQITYQGLQLFTGGHTSATSKPVTGAIDWAFAGARSAVWYGFLLALIAAELFAARTLRRLLRDSLGRPSLGELEGMVREPLGDPGLRLGFWRADSQEWLDSEGEILAPPEAGQMMTEVDSVGRPAVAIVHDEQLAEDPELLQAAGAVALLALENAELESAWKSSLRELSDSRARIVDAGDRERRKLERDLHDGAQHRLTAIQAKLTRAIESVDDERVVVELEGVSRDATAAAEELRMLSHGIYPTVLRSAGPVVALRSLAMTATIPIVVLDDGLGRSSSSIEAAIYFCCAEAIQNATKHAGVGTTVTVTLGRTAGGIHFTIADDGIGMPDPTGSEGDGLIGMRDRIGAVGGLLEVESALGRGTLVRGWISAGSIPDGAPANADAAG